MFVYVCLYVICMFLHILLVSSYIYTSSYMFVYFVFLLELKFVFSKIKMFKLLFILFVIKQMFVYITLYDIITYIVRKIDDNLFWFTFPRKKGCVIKEAVVNKEDRHCSTPILGQFYNKICGLVSWLVTLYWWETFLQYIAKGWVLIKK